MSAKRKSICDRPESQSKPLPQASRVTRKSSRRDVQPQPKPQPRSAPKVDDQKPTKRTRQTRANPENNQKQTPKSQEKKESKSTAKTTKKEEATPKKDAQDAKKKVEEEKKEPELKKVILKGTVPVDQYFSKPESFKVHTDQGKIYAATLNQSNINANNNKFYILQLLVNQSNKNDIIFFTRWGRVGVQGQKCEDHFKSIEAAVREYNKKLNEKVRKSYRLVQMNYEENAKQEENKQQAQEKNKDEPASQLDPSVQDLIRLIFDMKMMNRQMKEIGYDSQKMPLGKLAKSSIMKGYQILKGLMEEIKGKHRREHINNLSSDFYSEIPHDFGFQKMTNFVLDTEVKVKGKLQMLQSLEDIQVFTKLIDETTDSDMNQLDSNYMKLNMKVKPLDKNSPTYKLLLKYVENTHASTHTAYRLTVLDIFELQKETQIERYKKDIHNKQLLWHGSRLTNFVGILSQGLRIAPPEAPVTGYMFGKGVYFADMVTKSANYCFASRENNIGLMLLCEVALGNMNQKFYADYYANLLPEGKSSTKGCGKTAPKEGEMLDDVLVPCGEGTSTGITSTSLLYNEYIVYDVAQIKCRYLFKMKFNYQ